MGEGQPDPIDTFIALTFIDKYLASQAGILFCPPFRNVKNNFYQEYINPCTQENVFWVLLRY